jgi:hypothetical protein
MQCDGSPLAGFTSGQPWLPIGDDGRKGRKKRRKKSTVMGEFAFLMMRAR